MKSSVERRCRARKHARESKVSAVALLLMGMAVVGYGAEVEVKLAVTDLGGAAFAYDVTVNNAGTQDVCVVTIAGAPLADALLASTLTTPAGFLGSYDSGLGFVDFLEVTDLFAAGTTNDGFSFQSSSPPSGNFTNFKALTVTGDLLSGTVNLISSAPTGPVLAIMPDTPGFVAISWTPAAPGFVLQENPGLLSVNWTNSPSGQTNPVVVPVTAQPRFFRLFKQP